LSAEIVCGGERKMGMEEKEEKIKEFDGLTPFY